MAWFNEGLSSLKGQISNLTKEIVVPTLLADNTQGETGEVDSKKFVEQLEDKCRTLELEVEKLKYENSQLRQLEGSLQSSISSPEVATLDCEVQDDDFDDSFQTIGWGDDVWTDSFLGQEGEEVGEKKTKEVKPEDEVVNLQKQVNKLLLDKKKLKQRCVHLDTQVEFLSEQLGRATKVEEAKTKQSQITQTSEDFSNCITSSEYARMQQEFALLREERGQLRSELTSMTQIVQDLESQVRVSQDENANLSTGLEELDIQHQEAIDQMMRVKDVTQKQYESLLIEFDELKIKYEELENVNKTLSKTKKEVCRTDIYVQTENASAGIEEEIKKSFEKALVSEVKNILSSDISEQFNKNLGSEDSILSLVSNLAKGYENVSVEKKNCDVKIKELSSTLIEVEDELNSLEKENMTAKSTIDRLTSQCEALRPIPENDEELEALDLKVNTLEKEVNVLREVRSNLEVELTAARNVVSDLNQHLLTSEAMIKNQDNLENEISILQLREQSLQDEVNSLVKAKESFEKDIFNLKQELSNKEEVQKNFEELQMKYQVSVADESDNHHLIEENEQLKQQVLSLTAACNQKEEKFNELDLTYRNTCKKLSSLELKCSELDEILVSMKIENESKERKMCELILEKSASDKNLKELKEIHESFDAQLKDLQSLCTVKDSDNSNLKIQLEEINKKYEHGIKNLGEVTRENENLKSVINDLNVELKKKISETEDLKTTIKKLKENYSELENIKSEKSEESISLQQKVTNLEILVDNMKGSLECAEQEKSLALQKCAQQDSLQKRCFELENSVQVLENRLTSLGEENSPDLEHEILDLNAEIATLRERCSTSEKLVEKLKDALKATETEKNSIFERMNLEKKVECDNLQKKCAELEIILSETEQHLKMSEQEKISLSEKLNDMIGELNDKANCLQKINDNMKQSEEQKINLENKYQRLKDEMETIERDGEILENNKEKHEMALESVSKLSQAVADREQEIEDLKKTCRSLQDNLDQHLPKLLDERDQLIKSLQAKHMEGLEYHNEIQRLNKLLSEELNKTTKLTADISVINKNCLDLRQQIEEKEETMRHRDRELINLQQQVETLQNQLEYASQLLRVADRQEAEGQPSVDATNTMTSPYCNEQEKEYIASLERERNELAETLLKEQTRNKYLQNEVQEHHEKEMSLAKEVERLRSHLVGVEDNYTQEMVRAEEQVKELQLRLSQADERVKNSSTAYTSASIRANQQVETLQAQARLLLEQREKIQSQLSASEDKIQKQAAALTNLQIVLEQFQRDKEKDIALETERIKQSLQQEHLKNETLKDEVKSLQNQLKEAKEGLNAAARLGEQLERKDQALSDMRIEVKELTEKLQKMEEKIKATTTGVEGKVDRYLVKNLLVGYLSAPPQSRIQALRVLATVVDLSHEERQRVGLEPASKSEALQQQSLSEAFVRFLENESRPQHPLRLPMSETSTEPKSRRSSTSILLPDVLPNIPQFTVGRSSGSILKDVLKDDRL